MTTTPLFQEPTEPTKTLLPFAAIVKGVKGIESLAVQFGRHYTLFCGKNGVGKSSALDAFKNLILGSSALANMARVVDGETSECEVSMVLKGTDGFEEKHLKKVDDKTPTIKSRVGNSAAFETVKKPADYLRTISDQGADPAKFLTSAPKEQTEILLAALKLEWDQARVDHILGEFKPLVVAENLPLEFLHPLQKAQAIRDCVFRARTGVNRDEKAKRSAADQTLRDAPAEIPEGIEARIAAKRAEIDALAEVVTTETAKIASNYRERESSAEATRDAAIACARAEFDKAIAAAKEDASEEQAFMAKKKTTLEILKAEMATLQRDQTDATRARTMHETAAKFTRDADSFKDTADRMTATIEALDAFKSDMASDIPIEGLRITDAGITIGDVPLAQINTAKRVAVAFSIATLRLKGLALRILFLDNLESLDEEHRGILFALAKQHGVYILGAMVTPDETLIMVKG